MPSFAKLRGGGKRLAYERVLSSGLDTKFANKTLQDTLHSHLPSPAPVTAALLPDLHQIFASSFATLAEALLILPPEVHVELHILYPSWLEEQNLGLGPTPNINNFADALLTVVFEHARAMREQTYGFLRSIVFSSNNQDVCTALNWKQPNCE
jgi:CDK inhibitor PHO81